MKKVYIAPQTTTLSFVSEGIIAASNPQLGVKNDGGYQITGESEMLTNKQDAPWNSSNWE